MLIFKQNRCIALLVGVILVCFSAISLLHPGQVTEGKLQKVQLVKLQSAGRASVLALVPHVASSSGTKINSTVHSSLTNIAVHLSPAWKPEQRTEWVSRNQLAQATTAQPASVHVKAAVITTSLAAQKVQKQTAIATKVKQAVVKKAVITQQYPPAILFFSRTKLLSQDQQSQATWKYAVSDEDLLLLQKIVMAEAEGEPYQGKVAVANVVLNRLRSANFPDTIYKVIFQKSQFSPVANGRFERVKPNADSIKAVNAALSGVKEVTDDTYFFLSLKLAQDLTVKNSREYAKTIGDHTFYK